MFQNYHSCIQKSHYFFHYFFHYSPGDHTKQTHGLRQGGAPILHEGAAAAVARDNPRRLRERPLRGK